MKHIFLVDGTNALGVNFVQIKRKTMFRAVAETIGLSTFALMFLYSAVGAAHAQAAKNQYPSMAPLEQYRIANPPDEVALARSAAPASISADAVLVLGSHGYETAAKGKNGFVCIVERSRATNPDDAEFWNSKILAPICFNAPAARSVLANYLTRTGWILIGVSRPQITEHIKSALAKKTFSAPEPRGNVLHVVATRISGRRPRPLAAASDVFSFTHRCLCVGWQSPWFCRHGPSGRS